MSQHPRTFDVQISAADWWYLQRGDKCFIVIREPYPGLHYGDTLRLRCREDLAVLTRWVKYAESGINLLPNYVAIELAEGESPLQIAQRESRHETRLAPKDQG